MSIRRHMIDQLMKNGMFLDQASAVVALAEAGEPSMEGRWDQEADHYPAALLVVPWIKVRRYTLEWIDANLPDAWYRPLFDDANGEAQGP
jgi:hypothetical protein